MPALAQENHVWARSETAGRVLKPNIAEHGPLAIAPGARDATSSHRTAGRGTAPGYIR